MEIETDHHRGLNKKDHSITIVTNFRIKINIKPRASSKSLRLIRVRLRVLLLPHKGQAHFPSRIYSSYLSVPTSKRTRT